MIWTMCKIFREILITVLPLLLLTVVSYYCFHIREGFTTSILTSSLVFLSFLIAASSFLYTRFMEYVENRHATLAKLVKEKKKNEFETRSRRVEARLRRPQLLITITLRISFLVGLAILFSLLAMSKLPSAIVICNYPVDLILLFSATSLAFALLTIINVLYFLITLSNYARKRIVSLLTYIENRSKGKWEETPSTTTPPTS